jgi:multiple sugar transport system permease protein
MFGGDQLIGQATRNTLWFIVLLVPARLAGALFTAWMLTRARRASGVLRTIYYVPALIPPVASTLAFVFVFRPGAGPVDRFLALFHLHGTGWFTSPGWSKPSLLLLGLWVVGDVMVLFLAGLLDVPREQYEAAELDGANGWQQFRYVTLPAMTPIILFNLITGIIASLQYFTEPAVASGVAQGKATVGEGAATLLGWPGQSTLTSGQLLYAKAFGSHLLGYGSAMAVILFAVTLGVLVVLLRRFRAFTPDSAS